MYGEIKLKSGFKELVKLEGTSFKEANYLTSVFPKKAVDDLKTITEYFAYTQEAPALKKYTKSHVNVINDLFLIEGAIRNAGQHAAAVIQTPERDENGKPMNVWDWFPVKKVDGHLVSEWTGAELDKLGFTKNDFLGLSQLDKVKQIFALVKENKGIDLTFDNIPLDDEKTFFYFQEGYTQDIFQFSGDSMTAILIDLYPTEFEHLIATNALHRPGAIKFIPDYIDLRHGRKLPTYINGTEEALSKTKGLMIYQEDTMSISVNYSGFSMSEADDLRKIIGKKKLEDMPKMKEKFINGALKLGRDLDDTENIWNSIEQTGNYQFNRSHSTAYAKIGYITMYLKANYPMEFYTTALEFATDKKIPQIIAEMNRLGEAKAVPPSINESNDVFTPNFNTNKIYWSLSSVKGIGEAKVEKIITARNSGGKFFSIEDLLERAKVDKKSITNLIAIGAFDEIYDVETKLDRLAILKKYYRIIKEELPPEYLDKTAMMKEYFWDLKSRELTGLGYIDYKSIVPLEYDYDKFIDLIKFNTPEMRGNELVVCGVASNLIERKSKYGQFLTMDLDHNSEIINCLVWSDTYETIKKELKKSEGRIIFMSGIVKFDNFKQKNGVQSFDETKIVIL